MLIIPQITRNKSSHLLFVTRHGSCYLHCLCSGGRSHASCIDCEGVVHSVKVGMGATLGNMSLLFPGAKVIKPA
jgi:hypothetical protein